MDKDSDSSADSMPNEQQGIFSTPELTVDAEKLAQDVEDVNASSRAKIASIFANTETGKQTQRLNDAMATNVAPTYATEDIKLDADVKKKRKWLIVVAIMALVVIVGGVAVWFLVQNLGGQAKETPLEAFNTYREYLEKGPEDLRINNDTQGTDEWFIFQIRGNATFSNAEVNSYISTLDMECHNFLELLEREPYKNDLGVNLGRYYRLLELFTKSASLATIRQTLLDKYLDNGANVAYNYLAEVSPIQPDDEEYRAMTIVSAAIKAYLEAELNLLTIYDSRGCISNHILDAVCGEEFTDGDTAVTELISQQATAQQKITGYLRSLQPIFMEMTSSLSRSLEEYNV